jgi:CRP-like cAMP-binding protein
MKTRDIDIVWEGEPQCKHCGIRHLVLFADLDHDDFSLIHRPIEIVDFKTGDYIYRSGEEARYLYTVRRGLVKLVQYVEDGGQRIVRLLKQGDVAGIEALLGRNYQHDAVLLDTTQVCRIPVDVINALNDNTPRLHRRLMGAWDRALSDADRWLTELSTGTAKERVIRLFVTLDELCKEEYFYMPSREDIGSMLGITTETASRIVAELKRAELIRMIDHKHAVADIVQLKQLL